MNLSDIAIKRPVFTTMVMVALMILGITSFFRLGVDLFPDVSFPLVSITTPYPGAGPEDVEHSVTKPIEEAVSTLSQVDEVRSYSREGLSTVLVVFKIGTDIDQKSIDVRDHVTAAHMGMPSDVKDSTFLKVDPTAAPVLTLVLSGQGDPRDLDHLAEHTIKPLFEQVPGVAVVNVRGGAKREIQVNLNAAKLAAYNLTVGQVSRALAMENTSFPTGRITTGPTETSLRVQGEVKDWRKLADLAVANVGGQVVRVRDVGTVVDGTAEQRTLVHVDGKPAITLDIVKQGGGNTVAVADGVREALPEARAALPPGDHLDVLLDSSEFIRDNASDVERSIVLGGAAAILVIFLFMLDWRSTLISALALPTSVVTTFALMYAVGFTLNMMTLLGLSLAIGFLIDDAIVVRENIFRQMEEGLPPMEAASKGTREIALAVLATTFTILAVFVPVGFMGGIMGMFFKQFALTVAGAVSVSLFVAFTLDPMLSARLVKQLKTDRIEHENAFFRFVRGRLAALDATYRTLLGSALRWRKTTAIAAAVVFFTSLCAVGLTGSEFFPKTDRGMVEILLTLPAGSSLQHSTEIVGQMEHQLMADKDVTLVYSTIGRNNEARSASMRVNLVDKLKRKRTLKQVMADFRKTLDAYPGVEVTLREAGIIEGDTDIRQAPVNIEISGSDLGMLHKLSDEVLDIVKTTPGTADVDSSYSSGLPEVKATVDRDLAAQAGVNAATIGATLRSAMVGDVPTHYRAGEDDIDVRVRLREADRADRTQLAGLLVPTRSGPIPLRSVAKLVDATTTSTIERGDRERQITITANNVGRSLGEVVSDIQGHLDKLKLPPGYHIKFGGEAKDMRDSLHSFGVALLLAVLFVYVVLASQFESFIHPLTIMVSLPLAIVGALLGLFLTGWPMGMSALIGIILLMGLVTKNAILLVDRINQNRDEHGMEMIDAILEAGPVRLRPILMTSAAMVLGMLPTALSRGAGSEFRAPMAISVIGGVITSTFLTLVVVPVVYVWLDRISLRHRRDVRAHTDEVPLGDAQLGPAK